MDRPSPPGESTDLRQCFLTPAVRGWTGAGRPPCPGRNQDGGPQLSLEFSESEILDQDLPRAHLKALAAMGVGIALDDIGTGNISLANLSTLKLNQLKIDCSSLSPVGDGSATDLTQLIVSVSRFLGLETVAKKLESQDQADWARRAGITLGQGYQLCPPMPADGLADLLAGYLDPMRMPSE